jgi:hypothetical protein
MTDCRGVPIRTTGYPVWRESLQQSRISAQGTAGVVSVIRTGDLRESDEACNSLRVVDAEGNTTPVLEDPAGDKVGRPPRVRGFRTIVSGSPGSQFLSFELDADDPDGDLVGVYLLLTYTDGSLKQPPDGVPETVIPTVVGFLGTNVPILDGRPLGLDLVTGLERVTVFVVDREANATPWIENDPLGPA